MTPAELAYVVSVVASVVLAITTLFATLIALITMIVGAIALISNIATAFFTLLFVILAAISGRQFLAQLRRDSYQNISATMLELDLVFFNSPEMRPYFYEGKSLADEPDPLHKAKVTSLAESFNDFIDNLIAQRPYIDRNYWPAWSNYITYLYKNSPELSRFVDEHPDWYTRGLLELARTSGRASSSSR